MDYGKNWGVTLVVFAFGLANDAMAERVRATMPVSTIKIAYLMDNTLRIASIRRGVPDLVVKKTWKLPRGHGREEYAGLSCSQAGEMVAHMSTISGNSPGKHQRSEIVRLNQERETVEVIRNEGTLDLTWPVYSADATQIAATVIQADRDLAATIWVSTGIVRTYPVERSLSPHAWVPGEPKVLATGLDASGKHWETIELDLRSGKASVLGRGGRPIVQGSHGHVAVVEMELGDLIVIDEKGTTLKRTPGAFKELVAWVGASTLIAIDSRNLRDRFVFVDIETGRSEAYEATPSAEINGACVLSVSSE